MYCDLGIKKEELSKKSKEYVRKDGWEILENIIKFILDTTIIR